jgi:hypothetical protein
MFKKIWNFIDGNKTVLGLVVLELASAPFIPEKAISSIEWFGGVLTAIGVIHKGKKRSNGNVSKTDKQK